MTVAIVCPSCASEGTVDLPRAGRAKLCEVHQPVSRLYLQASLDSTGDLVRACFEVAAKSTPRGREEFDRMAVSFAEQGVRTARLLGKYQED
jgi:hypothetical protein